MQPPLLDTRSDPPAGVMLARGVCRLLAGHGFACLMEFTPERGKRVDVMALGPKGALWVVECKSSLADYRADAKWQGYLEWADRFFFAVAPDFPVDVLPDHTGLILADAWDGEIIRMPDETRLAPARRMALTRAFAQSAAQRLQAQWDIRP